MTRFLPSLSAFGTFFIALLTPHTSLTTTSNFYHGLQAEPRRPKGRKRTTISALNAAIEALNLTKELSSITPAKAVFCSASATLATVGVSSLMTFC